ncbi:MAG: hypothetical protein PVG39_06985 [Desulfobacteraceae bacterium]|jgi:hypothetical protein
MKRYLLALSIGILTAIAVQGTSWAAGPETKTPDVKFEVLSPWADADPIPFRGISPRLDRLSGKKIGLFVNSKRAAMPISKSVDSRLKEMYPDIQTIVFHSTEPNVNEIETKNKKKFTEWVKGVDAVIALVGD